MGPKQSVSIKDVATRAGVSTATVSRVLNQHSNVSNSVRRRVERAIAELGFRPNANARRLRTRKTQTMGLILRDVGNAAFSTLWKAAADAAAQKGYNILVTTSERDAQKERRAVDLMVESQVEGLVAFIADEDDSAFRERTLPFPLVLVESDLPGVKADRVGCGNVEGAYQAMAYLLQLGHRNYIVLAGSRRRMPGRGRFQGVLQALRDHEIENNGDVHQISRISGDYRDELLARLRGADRPTAIFAATAHLSIEVLTLLKEAGLSIPEDVSFIGFDNRELSQLLEPPLTTVERDLDRLGATAIDLLLQRLEGGVELPPQNVTVPTNLIIRRSCRPFRSELRPQLGREA